jgi:transposase
MKFERLSMARLEEIQRLIREDLSDRKIARILHCRRTTVRAIREEELKREKLQKIQVNSGQLPPAWTLKVDWKAVEGEIKRGFENIRIWEEYAQDLTSHSNFYKHTRKRFALLLQKTVTLREFNPGEYAEVDYAGERIEWIDRITGEVHEAHVFVGILCFSQLIFAYACEDEKKENWLLSHRKMLEYYGGVPRVLVCDQLKNGVSRSHLYDPDLNPDYVEFAKHYGTAVVPARVRHPKDKSLVEGAVKLVSRLYRWLYRRHTFTSLEEINRALQKTVERLNEKTHSRFRISRKQRFLELEKKSLKPLPIESYERYHWKTAIVHPDCTVSVEKNFYSAPHVHRGKELRVKISSHQVELFLDLERVALHSRVRGRVGSRVIDLAHLPENSRAYRETTPQNLLHQAKFIHGSLYSLIQELFEQDTLGNIRRVQGIIRHAYQVIQAHGRSQAEPWLEGAIAQMKRFNRIRVKPFEEFIKQEQKKSRNQEDRNIVRIPGNPMVRNKKTGSPTEQMDQPSLPI